MPSFIVTRTFHPVGQGAFYSEMFETESGKFLMVYDCGSTNSRTTPKALCKEIKDSFYEDQYDDDGRLIVDILFLSHFHNDHLNGLEHLAPKVLVCPFVDDEDVLMLRVMDHFMGDWNIRGILDPGSLFRNQPRIIRVSLANPEQTIEGGDRLHTLDDVSGMIASGTRIGVKSSAVDLTDLWYFIPYNFHYKNRLKEFKRLLEEGDGGKCAGGLSYDSLKADPKNVIQRYKTELRTICDTFSGKTNDQSLIVYSGPDDNKRLSLRLEYDYNEYVGWYRRGSVWTDSAALYYGDITLRESLVSSLTRSLTNNIKYIGTIQLPHHGSDRSFHECVLYYYDQNNTDKHLNTGVMYVMSVGSKSKTHPGKNVILTLRRMTQDFTIVKENRDSALTESWKIYYEKLGIPK